MKLIPELKLGFLNGWIYFFFYLIVFGIVLRTCSEEVRDRLYDRSLWTKKTKIITAIGKVFSLINIILIFFGVLQIGSLEFLLGNIFYFIGLIGLVISIINYRDTPLDEPITKGLYKISRNPQMVSIYILFFGMILLIGSWISILFLSISIVCSHFSILGEEKSLEQQYGEAYLEFKREIPRYFLFF
jgi:protein-S-isoprenylcysteine O-methyltransferase Ste14